MKIGVVGAGGWGTALAKVLTENGHEVTIWAYEQGTAEEINTRHTNRRFLPEVVLPKELVAVNDPEEAAGGKGMMVFAVPSGWARSTAIKFRPFISADSLVINAGKGFEKDSFKRLSQALTEEFGLSEDRILVLSGPNHSEEVGRRLPSATVVACSDRDSAEKAQEVFISPYFRVYTNPDRIGVEIGGALKNIFAMAAGICEGLGYGDNTKAALVTRALAEMRRLGQAMGANPLTFSGLSGLGDLYVTASSRHSRNNWAGREIGKGKSLQEILDSTPMVVEGVPTTKAAYHLGQKYGVELPIVNQVHRILFEGYPPRQAVEVLMTRERTHELEALD